MTFACLQIETRACKHIGRPLKATSKNKTSRSLHGPFCTGNDANVHALSDALTQALIVTHFALFCASITNCAASRHSSGSCAVCVRFTMSATN